MERGGRTSSHQHHAPGLGHGVASRGRCQAARSRRGWFAPVRWAATCCGHNVGWGTVRQWATHEKNSRRRWGAPCRRKERTYPELVGRRGRATLAVLAGEVGGRWSGETRSFLNQLAKVRARSESILMRKRVEQAWRLRWASMLSCVAARAVASSLLDLRRPQGADGATAPSHEVDREFRYAGLA